MQDLDKFKNEMNLSGKNVYVGQRYVPKIMGDWDNSKTYEPLTIVQYQGNSFTSRQYVPTGVEITNEEYWASTGNYNAQIEQYRQDVRNLENDVNNFYGEVIEAREGKDTLNERLASDKKRIELTPDDFEGTDLEKIQKAYDYAVDNEVRTIHLNRKYDLTGGSVILKSGNFVAPIIHFIHGGLTKQDAGYMFTRSEDDGNNTNSPIFTNVQFNGNASATCYVINADKMIRSQFINCAFDSVGLLETNSYTQSVRVFKCVMTNSPATFIKGKQHIDMDIDNNRFETSPNPLIEGISNSVSTYANIGVRITNNLIEGYTTSPTIIMSSALGLVISNNYLEHNKGHIKFINGGGLLNIAGEINANYLTRNSETIDIEFDGHLTHRLEVSNNTTNVSSGKALLSNTVAIANNNNMYAGGTLYPLNTYYPSTRKNMLRVTSNDENGLTVVFDSPTGSTTSMLGLSFLVSVSASFGNSVNYRAVYTGILNFNGFYETDESLLKLTATINNLTMAGVGGNTTGLNGTDSDVIVSFRSTGSNTINTGVANPIVEINFPKLVHNSDTRVSIKPISDLLFERNIPLI